MSMELVGGKIMDHVAKEFGEEDRAILIKT